MTELVYESDFSENSTVKLLPLTLQLHIVDALVSSLTQ